MPRQSGQKWDLLTDDTWSHIIAHLGFWDTLNVSQSCRRFHALLANPTSPHTWGTLELTDPKPKFVWALCRWMQPRLKGISRICYVHKDDDSLDSDSDSLDSHRSLHMRMMWHALVAATANCPGIRLKLSSTPPAPLKVLQNPAREELRQRLTALDVDVEIPAVFCLVVGMVALRHLKLLCPASAARVLVEVDAGDPAWLLPLKLHNLRTLQLIGAPPAAFFVTGAAAAFQHLHALSLRICRLVDGVLPSEMLQLQSLRRLELWQLPLWSMPDLRGLPALRTLLVCGKDERPSLDAKQARGGAELRAALRSNPLGAAKGLTDVVLHGISVPTQECAEAIERLPDLKMLALDPLVSEQGAYWAATLQYRLLGRCSVELSSAHVTQDDNEQPVLIAPMWPDDDW